MNRQLLFIRNPTAGSFRAQNTFLEAADEVFRSSYNTYLYSTRYGGDAARIVAETGPRYDRIVCFGGDGTLNEVINGLMHLEQKPELGYIPAGTTNDFAAGLGLSKDPVQAARDAVSGKAFPLDVGETGTGKFFSYVASFGSFTSASYSAPQDVKNAIGYPAYLLEGIKSLADLHKYHVRVVSDEVDVEDDFIYGGVSNSTSLAGLIKLTRDQVDMNDGVFEVLLIRVPANVAEFADTVNAIFSRSFKSSNILFFKTAHISFECSVPFAWTIDGEFAGVVGKMELFNRFGAINMVRPGAEQTENRG